jgi:hypothetical protein
MEYYKPIILEKFRVSGCEWSLPFTNRPPIDIIDNIVTSFSELRLLKVGKIMK